jgi:hypothetical protein
VSGRTEGGEAWPPSFRDQFFLQSNKFVNTYYRQEFRARPGGGVLGTITRATFVAAELPPLATATGQGIMVQGERPEWDPPRRGKRFTLHWPVWYRATGEREWHSGMTENISYSGALIHTEASIVPATAVVVVIAMPSTPSSPRACLVGEGRIVRSVTPLSRTEGSAFAVAVPQYRFDRSGQVLDTITQ